MQILKFLHAMAVAYLSFEIFEMFWSLVSYANINVYPSTRNETKRV
jgi:hypothetical protein